MLVVVSAAVSACGGSGTAYLTGGRAGSGGGINGIAAAQKVIGLINSRCPDPTSETICPAALGCCPDTLSCCSGSNAGLCASDCDTTYESNGCTDDAPDLCGDVCCPSGCDDTETDCADSSGDDNSSSSGSGSGGSSGGGSACDETGADCSGVDNCCNGCDTDTDPYTCF